ncbi:MAG: Rossmann-like domain-containing protein [Candidatus Muiribacteriaceae bacterium]
MKLNSILYDLFREKAGQTTISYLGIGLGYTYCETEDGGKGLSYTWIDGKKSCSMLGKGILEGKNALEVLQLIHADKPLLRTVALALINALNYKYANTLPEDKKGDGVVEKLKLESGMTLNMVGYFGPLVTMFEKMGITVNYLDNGKNMGLEDEFFTSLKEKADVLYLTSTSLLNSSTEDILARCPDSIKKIMIGPSTPMVREIIDEFGFDALAGTVSVNPDGIKKAVRNAQGTPVIQRSCKKSFLAF